MRGLGEQREEHSGSHGTSLPQRVCTAGVPSVGPACSSDVFRKGARQGPVMSKSVFFTCLPTLLAMWNTVISPYHHSILVFFSFL